MAQAKVLGQGQEPRLVVEVVELVALELGQQVAAAGLDEGEVQEVPR